MINSLRKLLAKMKPIRGRQRILMYIDERLGPMITSVRDGGTMLLFLSSSQDCSFLSTTTESNPLLIEAIEQLPESGIFVDIGANAGFYSLKAACLLGEKGRIISVEPSDREFYRLAFSKAMNRHSCRWDILNLAVGNDDEVAIDINIGHTGMNKVSLGDAILSSRVGSMTLDRVLDIYELGRVDLLKIDVEGYELEVLRGLTRRLGDQSISKLLIEITDKYLSHYGDSRTDLYRFLEKYGYKGVRNAELAWQYDELFIADD